MAKWQGGMTGNKQKTGPNPIHVETIDSSATQITQSQLPQRSLAALFVFMFVLLIAPWASQFTHHHPDEYHYVDGGAFMIEHGQWLFPHTADGELRLVKPVLPYWLSAAGLWLGDASLLGVRGMWLLAAAITLFLTYLIANIVSANSHIALTSLVLTAANPILIQASFTTTPDMPLTLFMTLAAYGGLGAMNSAKNTSCWSWWFWIGVALAVLSKGMLPLLFVGYVIIFLGAFDRSSLLRLAKPAPIVIAFCVIAAWYGFAYFSYPDEFITQFFGDQIFKKMTHDWWHPTGQFLKNMMLILCSAFPLSIIALFRTNKFGKRREAAAHISSRKFILTWIFVVAVVFAFSKWTSHLYFLPLIPLLSVFLAIKLHEFDIPPSLLRRYFWSYGALMFSIVSIVSILVVSQIGNLFDVLFVIIISFVAIATLRVSLERWKIQIRLSAIPLILLAIVTFPIQRIVLPDLGQSIANAIPSDVKLDRAVVLIGNRILGSELKIALRHAVPVTTKRSFDPKTDCSLQTVVTLDQGVRDSLEECGFDVTVVRAGWREVDLQVLFNSLVSGDLKLMREKYLAEAYVVAKED
ncbi:MAG: phospholipid carrier-dependent glycosyltransferase [Pseudomonadota bacterium]